MKRKCAAASCSVHKTEVEPFVLTMDLGSITGEMHEDADPTGSTQPKWDGGNMRYTCSVNTHGSVLFSDFSRIAVSGSWVHFKHNADWCSYVVSYLCRLVCFA